MSDWLKRECERYGAKYGYAASNLDRGLEAFVAHLFVQEAGFELILDGVPSDQANLGEFICRNNDLGIDVVLEDEIDKKIMLVQATWRKTLAEDKVAAFFDAPARLMSPDYVEHGSEQTQQLLAGFKQKVNDGYSVHLRFVASMNVTEKSRFNDLVDARNQAYEEADQAIFCELFGSSELAKHAEEIKSAVIGGFVGKVSIKLPINNFFILNDPYRTIVGAIKANELVDLYNRHDIRNKLFNLNIRLPLASQKVNPKMVDTAIEPQEGRHFFYYNNGVSAVCSRFTIAGNEVTADRLQIINGAQTVSALVKARRKMPTLTSTCFFGSLKLVKSMAGASLKI